MRSWRKTVVTYWMVVSMRGMGMLLGLIRSVSGRSSRIIPKKLSRLRRMRMKRN
jgi:hypothetical protein